MTNPFKALNKKEFGLWIVSMVCVVISNMMSQDFNYLTLAAAVIGVTAVLFEAKGHLWGQILIAIFSVFYGIISWQFHYWGEMITYMGMSLPMALWAIYTWAKHPSEKNAAEVKVNYLSGKQKVLLVLTCAAVTALFYKILAFFNTPNLLFSTISITTSFMAVTLTMCRSSYYAFWYALNDIVLIIMWLLAARVDSVYYPMVVNFGVFMINDIYGFISWKKREKRQGRKGKSES